jgi:peptidoglycan/xylan/chitin deacetylase (PgdA/CDA1 family)
MMGSVCTKTRATSLDNALPNMVRPEAQRSRGTHVKRRDVFRTAAIGVGAAGLAACADNPTHRAAVAARPNRPSTTPSASAGASTPTSPTTVLPAEVVHGPRNRQAVALTFHGQGAPDIVDRLLSTIEQEKVHVTVLAVGTWLVAEPAMAQRVLGGGHELGNHTQHHLDIVAMNATQAFAEIDQCAATLKRLTGTVGRWFRPSQTQHSTATIRAEARRAGYPTCLSYDVDSLDYTDPPAAKVVAATLGAVQPGSIVSMHFGHPVTIEAIGPIIAGLRQRGLRPVTMSELVAP